jgi:hypothetical protein
MGLIDKLYGCEEELGLSKEGTAVAHNESGEE